MHQAVQEGVGQLLRAKNTGPVFELKVGRDDR